MGQNKIDNFLSKITDSDPLILTLSITQFDQLWKSVLVENHTKVKSLSKRLWNENGERWMKVCFAALLTAFHDDWMLALKPARSNLNRRLSVNLLK